MFIPSGPWFWMDVGHGGGWILGQECLPSAALRMGKVEAKWIEDMDYVDAKYLGLKRSGRGNVISQANHG